MGGLLHLFSRSVSCLDKPANTGWGCSDDLVVYLTGFTGLSSRTFLRGGKCFVWEAVANV